LRGVRSLLSTRYGNILMMFCSKRGGIRFLVTDRCSLQFLKVYEKHFLQDVARE